MLELHQLQGRKTIIKKSNVHKREGETNYNSNGSRMEIIKYINYQNVLVEFKNSYTKRTSYNYFKEGCVRNLYDKTVWGEGYAGEGPYKMSVNKKHTREYRTWKNILQRVYSDRYQEKYPTYKKASITKDWLNFQNYAEWHSNNYYEVGNEKMHIDKDILHKGNKTYSPHNCIFVPEKINLLFTKRDSGRGDYPLGVSYCKRDDLYTSYCSNHNGFRKFLGNYNTPEKAFDSYKVYKENLIKKIANKYKNEIPLQLYEAMMNYVVEIDD